MYRIFPKDNEVPVKLFVYCGFRRRTWVSGSKPMIEPGAPANVKKGLGGFTKDEKINRDENWAVWEKWKGRRPGRNRG